MIDSRLIVVWFSESLISTGTPSEIQNVGQMLEGTVKGWGHDRASPFERTRSTTLYARDETWAAIALNLVTAPGLHDGRNHAITLKTVITQPRTKCQTPYAFAP
jgi:hypothetical protein